MQHLEGSRSPVLYIERTVLKGYRVKIQNLLPVPSALKHTVMLCKSLEVLVDEVEILNANILNFTIHIIKNQHLRHISLSVLKNLILHHIS
jgi:hypothetical protein